MEAQFFVDRLRVVAGWEFDGVTAQDRGALTVVVCFVEHLHSMLVLLGRDQFNGLIFFRVN